MDCLICVHLGQSFKSKLTNYCEARSAIFHQVSTELTAKTRVDMERARIDLEEHRLECPVKKSRSFGSAVPILPNCSLQPQRDSICS